MNVFDLQAKIGLNTNDFVNGLKVAGTMVTDFGKTVSQTLFSATKELTNSVNEVATLGDAIDKQSQKMNMSAEAYQEWDAILKHSGTNIDSMQSSMKTLANAVETGNDAFKQLGFTEEELSKLNSEEIFSRTITALQNVESDTERTYLAGQLLGRGATELGALLNTSAKDTERMRQRVHELGGVLSDEAVKNSAKFKDSLQDMQTAISGVKRNLETELLPSFTEVMDGITDIFTGENGVEKVTSGINSIMDSVSNGMRKGIPTIAKTIREIAPKLIPSIASTVGSFASSIIQTAIENAPMMLELGGELLSTMGKAIVENIPKLQETASQTIRGLAGYLKDNLPTLIPKGVEAVVEFGKGLTSPDTISTMIDAAGDIIDGLVKGLTDPKTLDAIIDGAPAIVESVCDGIAGSAGLLIDGAAAIIGGLSDYMSDPENVRKMEKAGEDILDSVVKGFTSLLESSGTSIYNLGGHIAYNLGLGEYWEVGNDAMKDFAKGFKAEWEEFKKWFNISVKDLLDPTNMIKNVADSVSGRIGELIDEEKKGKATTPFNYDELPTLDTSKTTTRSAIPYEYREKHGNLNDRKHALGGIFTRPVTIGGHTFGENGIEGLLPLENNTTWMDKLVDKINGSGGTRNYYITVNADHVDTEADFDRLVEKIDQKLSDRHVMANRAIGATGW